jgi:ferredoxin
MNVSTDTERCVGAGNCVLTAPEVFDQDDSGVVVVLQANPAPKNHTATQNAMLNCPAQAITVDDPD